MSSVRITTIAPVYFAGLEALQQVCYPTLGTHELMTVAHFASQYRVFAEGQIVAVADLPDGNDLVVGQGSGFLIDFDFTQPDHRFSEICDGFYFTRHNANGAYYYGDDISVHPDYRGQGIGSRIYRARQDLVKRLHRRGIVAGGLIPGYADHKSTLSVQAYVDQVVAGELFDPTLSFQLRSGFRVRGLIRDYIEDSASDNWATLIEWVNPEWEA